MYYVSTTYLVIQVLLDYSFQCSIFFYCLYLYCLHL